MPRVVHQTKTEIALQVLRERIRRGELKPGERFRLSELRDDLGMSPTPIREALRVLQADGLVTYHSHHGITVASLSRATLSELSLIRSTLEALATKLAVPKLSDRSMNDLVKTHEELVVAMESGAGKEVMDLNANWHWQIYDAAESTYLNEFIRRLWDRYPWRTMWVLPGRLRKSIDEHAAVMDAILARDAAEAGERMSAHIKSGEQSLLDSGASSEDGTDDAEQP